MRLMKGEKMTEENFERLINALENVAVNLEKISRCIYKTDEGDWALYIAAADDGIHIHGEVDTYEQNDIDVNGNINTYACC